MGKLKKKPTTSEKRGPGRPRREFKVKMGDKAKSFKRAFSGQDPYIEITNDVKPDTEETLPTPEDVASDHAYPPPKKDPKFREVWLLFIDSISGRENFKVGHLRNLEILCDLYVEYESLQKFIRTKGRSYLSVGRAGEVWKFYPEVSLLGRVQSQIKDYTKMLNLVPKKDHTSDSGGEKDDWS